jgi:hypothetical protein
MKPSKTSQSHSQETPSATQAQFGDLWPVHNRWFGAVMSECRRYFDGDLDQVLILTIIGTRSVYPKRLQGISYDDFRRGLRNDGPVMPINTQSVADSTGIPRESVRRKIGQLIERGGWRSGKTGTCASPSARFQTCHRSRNSLWFTSKSCSG